MLLLRAWRAIRQGEGGSVVSDGEFTSLYPERPEVFCKRCRCWHFADGRCFAKDPIGWAIIRPVVFPRLSTEWARPAAETEAAVRPEDPRRNESDVATGSGAESRGEAGAAADVACGAADGEEGAGEGEAGWWWAQ